MTLDEADRSIIRATQGGLPFEARPYHAVAEATGLSPEDVMERLRRMAQSGVIRRIGAVPNHYAIGWRANGMSVWDIDDGEVSRLGPKVGELDFVSHCYRRPRQPPVWPYNLFAMVHGRSREEVEAKVAEIEALLGGASRAHAVLYSTRVLKKAGLRLAD